MDLFTGDNLTYILLAAGLILLIGQFLWVRYRAAQVARRRAPPVSPPPADPTPPAVTGLRPAALFTENQSGGMNVTGGSFDHTTLVGRDQVQIVASAPIVQQTVNGSGNIFTGTGDVYVGAPTPRPAPQGHRPASNAPVYIDRGPIEQQVRAALSAQGRTAIVGVHAPGGTGKTELAKGVMRDLQAQFPDDPCPLWVDCGEKTPEQIVGDMGLRCGLTFAPAATYRDRVLQVQGFLNKRRVLLILDDVRSANAARLEDFFPASPPCGVLITSRSQQPSHAIPPDAIFRLEGMSLEQARALLEAALSPERVQAEAEAAGRLIERCKHNPLALDIAARRIAQFEGAPRPIALFETKLHARLSELKVGTDPRLDLFAVFAVSYDDLAPADQARFRRLAAFAPTGFSVPAAAALWGDDLPAASDAIARLLTLSMVKLAEGSGERYRLHDLLDEYAARVLHDVGEEAACRSAHAE
ncbi:MAG: NB-ARC domain-containing protein [Anaerolineae bacterium]